MADAAIEMMTRETWSGMFVTMGAIDKAAHMWGAQDDAANFTGACHTAIRSPTARPRRTFDAPPRTPTSSSARSLDAVEALDAATAARPWSC